MRAHAFSRSVTVARSSAVQASSGRRQESRWAIVCGSPQSQSTNWASSRYPHLLITVFARPIPVRSQLRARQQSQSSPYPTGKRLGHLQSHFDGGWHVCLSVWGVGFCPRGVLSVYRLSLQSLLLLADETAHEALPRLQSASSWLVMKQLVSGVCHLRSMRHATVLLM